MLVQADTAWTECNDEQEATDDGQCLEEIVLQKVVEWLVRVDCPERVREHIGD